MRFLIVALLAASLSSAAYARPATTCDPGAYVSAEAIRAEVYAALDQALADLENTRDLTVSVAELEAELAALDIQLRGDDYGERVDAAMARMDAALEGLDERLEGAERSLKRQRPRY